ncbi:MAG: DsbC family protein [Gammaproteobacteria bacterium]|nr:MAG: DsbC family protein [Gammaproteobacteria bacterium]
MKILLIAISMILSLNIQAAFSSNSQNTTPEMKYETISTSDLKAFDKPGGGIVFVTSDGRYAIKGTVVDTWTKTPLNSLKEIAYSTSHINLDAMGLDIKALNVITLGNGPRRITVFVDPLCALCKELVKQAQKKTNEFTFNLVVVPALGDKSQLHAKSLFCAEDKSDSLNAYLNQTLKDLKQKKTCDTKNYDLTLLSATLFNIKAVPWMIADDGRTKYGAADLWKWLAIKNGK